MKEMQGNIYWINSLKAIGIILVMIGHNDTIFTNYIYSFHMPLFFFLSGFLFNEIKWKETKPFIYSRVKSLIIPYFILSFILYIVWIPLDLIQGKSITKEILINNLIGIFYSQGAQTYMKWGLPMWFLTCLFVVSILFFFINKYFIDKLLIVLICSAIVGYICTYLPFHLPWSIDIAFVALVFYGVGYYIKKWLKNYKYSSKSIPLIIILLICSVTLSSFNGRGDMYSGQYNNYIIFYGAALTGILLIILLVKLIPNNKIMNFIGVNTIIILAFHIRALEVIKFITMKILKLNIDFNSIIMGGIILPVLQILLLLPVIIIANIILIKYNDGKKNTFNTLNIKANGSGNK